jgi:hypothetical protein
MDWSTNALVVEVRNGVVYASEPLWVDDPRELATHFDGPSQVDTLHLDMEGKFSYSGQLRGKGPRKVYVAYSRSSKARDEVAVARPENEGIVKAWKYLRRVRKYLSRAVLGVGVATTAALVLRRGRQAEELTMAALRREERACPDSVLVLRKGVKILETMLAHEILVGRDPSFTEEDLRQLDPAWQSWIAQALEFSVSKKGFHLIPVEDCAPRDLTIDGDRQLATAWLNNQQLVSVFRHHSCQAAHRDLVARYVLPSGVTPQLIAAYMCLRSPPTFTLVHSHVDGTLWDFLDDASANLNEAVVQIFRLVTKLNDFSINAEALPPEAFVFRGKPDSDDTKWYIGDLSRSSVHVETPAGNYDALWNSRTGMFLQWFWEGSVRREDWLAARKRMGTMESVSSDDFPALFLKDSATLSREWFDQQALTFM